MTWDPDDKWSPDDVRDLIADLRGDPTKCDFCDKAFSPEDLIPEEGGLWSCRGCWNAFYHEEKADGRGTESGTGGGGCSPDGEGDQPSGEGDGLGQ